MNPDSYALLANSDVVDPKQQETLLRELLTYDVQCPVCSPFSYDSEMNVRLLNPIPSPMHWSRQIEWPWAIATAELTSEMNVLDIGGSWSVLTYAIAKRCSWLWTLDNDTESIRKASGSHNLLGFRNIVPVVGDARKLPYEDETFDRVFCISVLEHITDGWGTAVDEIKRVLKPGGVAIVTFDTVKEVEGEGRKDFFVGEVEASQMLLRFGIDHYSNNRAVMSQIEGKVLYVTLLKWTKPME